MNHNIFIMCSNLVKKAIALNIYGYPWGEKGSFSFYFLRNYFYLNIPNRLFKIYFVIKMYALFSNKSAYNNIVVGDHLLLSLACGTDIIV